MCDTHNHGAEAQIMMFASQQQIDQNSIMIINNECGCSTCNLNVYFIKFTMFIHLK